MSMKIVKCMLSQTLDKVWNAYQLKDHLLGSFDWSVWKVHAQSFSVTIASQRVEWHVKAFVVGVTSDYILEFLGCGCFTAAL